MTTLAVMITYMLVNLAAGGADIQEEVTVTSIEDIPSQEFVDRIRRIFDNAYIITLNYTPIGEMGSIGYSAEMAKTSWRNRVAKKCLSFCEVKAEKLLDFFVSGLRADKECSRPFSLHIELDDLTEKTDLYVNVSMRCFIFDGVSYITKHQLIPNMDSELSDIWQ